MENLQQYNRPKFSLPNSFERRLIISVLLAVLSIVFSLVGWTINLRPTSFQAAADVLSKTTAAFVPSVSSAEAAQHGLIIMIGKYLGMFATLCGAFLVGVATIGHTLSVFWNRVYRSGHSLVIGNSTLSHRLVRILGENGHYVIHVLPDEIGTCRAITPHLYLGHATRDLVNLVGLGRAANVIVDGGSDASTLAIGESIRAALVSKGQNSLLRLCLRVSDPILALSTANDMLQIQPTDPPRPLLFDENQLIAQSFLREFQLFRVAHALGQSRVHALIVGFGDLGEKFFDQIMLTSIAGRLAEPTVTVVDRDVKGVRARFQSRRPCVLSTLQVNFVNIEVGRDPLEDFHEVTVIRDLLELGRASPYTCIFVALGSDSETLQSATLLRRLSEKHELFKVPIISCLRGVNATARAEVTWSDQTPRTGNFVTSLSDQELYEYVILSESRWKFARRLHDNYRRSQSASTDAMAEWKHLKESYRRATMRAVDHLPAKLWSLGVVGRIKDNGEIDVSASDLEELRHILSTAPMHPKLLDLAKLEHERWLVERKLDGWRYGPNRNNQLLIHDRLVSWDELQKSPEEVQKDVDQVITALGLIVSNDRQAKSVFRNLNGT